MQDELTAAPRLLIAAPHQFGYLTFFYQSCRHLRHDFKITYVCWDYGLEPITLDNVRVIQASRDGSKIRRMARYLRMVIAEIGNNSYDIVLVQHFALCFIIPLVCGRRRMVLDIRTGHVRGNALSIWAKNLLLTAEGMFFSHITIISESLRRMLRIPSSKAHVIPPGADTQHFPEKAFDGMRLLYVGSLASRRIYETVQGLDRFCREYRGSVAITYDIVGFGRQEDEQRLREAIANSSGRDIVTVHGRIPHTSLRPFLEKSNIGIAYIPIIPRYDCQPPLKLIEYLLSGMAVIATRTSENTRLVRRENGVLITDSAEGVYEGLKQVLGMLHAYRSGVIKSALQQYTWEAIIRDNLRVYLLNILQLYKNVHR